MTVPAMIATGAIPRFLDSIKKSGIPTKVDNAYLKAVGFKNSNDMALVPLFKQLGFLDSSGQPTDSYREYRAAPADDARKVLGTAVMTCYSGLFEVYPDAYRKDDEALTNWIRAHTEKGEATQARALKTFKALRDASTFETESSDLPEPSHASDGTQNDTTPRINHTDPARHIGLQTGPNITINITLQIQATDDASIYDKFFASMQKHLFTNES
jgi:Family of unknown function (DUF5343)